MEANEEEWLIEMKLKIDRTQQSQLTAVTINNRFFLFRMPKRSFDGLDGICVGQQAVYQPQMKNKISERILLQNSSCDRAKEEKKKIETKTLNMLFSAQKKKGFIIQLKIDVTDLFRSRNRVTS